MVGVGWPNRWVRWAERPLVSAPDRAQVRRVATLPVATASAPPFRVPYARAGVPAGRAVTITDPLTEPHPHRATPQPPPHGFRWSCLSRTLPPRPQNGRCSLSSCRRRVPISISRPRAPSTGTSPTWSLHAPPACAPSQRTTGTRTMSTSEPRHAPTPMTRTAYRGLACAGC